MEGNDLGTYSAKVYVVTMTPTLFIPPYLNRRERLSLRAGLRKPADFADKYHINDLMCRWIAQQGYLYSIPVDIWSFEEEDLFFELADRLSQVIDRYVFRFTRHETEEAAVSELMSNLTSITKVYDADHDRVDRLWRFHGHRVMLGGAP